MNKVVLVALFALVAIAYVSAEEAFGAEVETLVQVEESAELSAKSALRESTRLELQDAFIYANMDTMWLEDQELLETKQSGSGYQEMTGIMVEVDKLEKKIQDKLAMDLQYITDKRAYCASTNTQMTTDLKNLANRIAKNNAVMTNEQGNQVTLNATVDKCRANITTQEKTVAAVSDARRIDTDAYQVRLAKRLNEISVLNQCLNLTCTSFSDFTGLKVCTDYLANNASTAESPGQITSVTLKDLLDQAAAAASSAAAATSAAASAASAAAASALATTAPTVKKATTEDLMKQLLLALQSADLPERTFVPARKIIAMIRSGQAAKAGAFIAIGADPVPTNAPTPTQDTGAEKNLPESLIALLQRIVDDQKRETIDFMNQLQKYKDQILSATNVVVAESQRVTATNAAIVTSQALVQTSKDDNTLRSTQVTNTTAALATLVASCNDEESKYNVRYQGRQGELVNVQKLRSLLRVLQNSDLPKCPGDCTAATQGRCVWKGLYGADSYCACSKGFYGNACQFKMCPGPGGSLYQADNQNVCSGRGTCNNDPKSGACTCSTGFYHGQYNSCEYKVCPGGGNCNNRGTCDKVNGTCTCFNQYYGGECQRTKCPASDSVLVEADNRAVCSGNGACDFNTGNCTCSARYTGRFCQILLCPGNCSGRGTCDTRTGTCQCSAPFYGGNCEYRTCPENCGSAGACDANSGRCNCNAGYSGPSCRQLAWCNNQTVNITNFATQNWNWASCPSGQMITALVRLWSFDDTLNSLRYMNCATPCEGGRQMNLQTCYEHDWTYSFDVQGWSTCNSGFFLQGLLKSSCNFIYCLERVRCCSIQDGENTACTSFNWWGCLDSSNWCGINNGYFIYGLYRTSDQWYHNIEEAASCMPRRNAAAPML